LKEREQPADKHDGEAVVLGVDGVSDFDALQSRRHDDEVQLYAFDMLAGDGDDYPRKMAPRSHVRSNASWRDLIGRGGLCVLVAARFC